MYVGDSSCHHSSSEQLTCGLSVSVEKKKKRNKERLQKHLNVYLCVCGPRGFPEIHQQSGFFTPLLCGTGRLWLPLPIRHARTELSDFGRTFIVTICTIYRSGLISFIVFLWKNNPNSLYNALTREFPLLYAI